MGDLRGEFPPAALTIRLFGPFDLCLHGEPVAPLRSRKGQWLLALLVLRHGREVRREWLAETLWPDSFGEEAFASLRQSLRDLRVKLGAEAWRVESPTNRTLRFAVAGADIDLLRFDAAVADGRPEALEEAVSLYTGPLLEGCTEIWVLAEREQREQAYLSALEHLAERALAGGEVREAIRLLRRCVAAAPFRQSAHRALMHTLQEAGELQAAVEVYQELRRRLYQELNAPPDPETVAAYEALRATARAGSPVPPAQAPPRRSTKEDLPEGRKPLPQPLTALIGREADVARLLKILHPHPAPLPGDTHSDPGFEQNAACSVDHGSPVPPRIGGWGADSHHATLGAPRIAGRGANTHYSRLVTLTGPGGVGKTRLSLEVANLLQPDYREGAAFIDLSALTEAAAVSPAVAAALGIRPEGKLETLEVLQTALHGREQLLVLDNCEHLLPACAELAAGLARSCPEVRILATSRQRLGITGETVHPVQPLRAEGPVEALARGPGEAGQPESPAIRLFLERASAVVPGYVPTPADRATLSEICRRLDGLPLAIELAAPLLEILTPAEILRRLEDRFQLLTAGDATGPERHRSLRALIDWSYTLLTPADQELFQVLSVFAGSWSLEAAEAVAEGDGVAQRVGALAAKSLVAIEPAVPALPGAGGGSSRRFRLLESLREYAAECLRASGREAAARERHLDHFLRLAEQADPELTGPRQSEWLSRLDTDYDNLRAALERPLKDEGDMRPLTPGPWPLAPAKALRLAAALGRYWQIRGLFTEGRHHLASTLRPFIGSPTGALPEVDPATLARALGWAGFLATYQGDYGEAADRCERSLALWRKLGEGRGIAAALGTLGILAKDRGDREQARSLFEESRALYSQAGDRSGTASMLGYLGILAVDRGDETAARALYEESLGIRRDLGDRWGVAASLNNLGLLERGRGHLLEARRYLEESLALRRELGDRRCIAISLNQLGLVHLAEGDRPGAGGCFRESLQIAREIGDRRSVAYSLETLARLSAPAEDAGDPTAALRAIRLCAAAQSLREALPAPLPPVEEDRLQEWLDALRRRVGTAAYDRAWREGRAQTPDEALLLALSA